MKEMKQVRFGDDHPLVRARWIWPDGNCYLNNCHAQFRYDFQLNSVPAHPVLFISADQLYRLYVNGRYVCRGPARGYQESWPFDEADLSAFLQEGHNWISAEVYNPGIGTFQYLHHGTAGFICAAEWDSFTIYSNSKDWWCRRSPANRQNIARQSVQMAFQEDFNAEADDLSWIYSPVPPDRKAASPKVDEKIFGKPPYYAMEERGIPMLRENTVPPMEITAVGTGTMATGYENAFNLAWHWEDLERKSVKVWNKSPDLPVSRDDSYFSFTVPEQPENGFIALVLKMDRIRIGTFGIELENGLGGEIADALFYQYLPDDVPVDLPPCGYGGQIAPAARFRAASGKSGRMFFAVQGFRYIVLVLRNVRSVLKIRTTFRNAEYPFAMRGKFQTSDAELNAIHTLCRNTQQICASDAYLDTPWREQGQWWGDARIQGQNTFYLDGDVRLFRRGIRSIAGQQTKPGLTMGVAPCVGETCILPDFSLTWILTIYDYYWQTGDLSLFQEQKERIRMILNYFHTPEARGENGFLRYDPRFWLFEDWAPLPKRGFPCFLNLFYCFTLSHLQILYRANGDLAEADEIEREYADLKDRILRVFFDPVQNLFLPGLEDDGSPVSEPPSLHDQVLAVLNGFKPEAYETIREKRILPFLRDESCDFAVPTSFWCSYLFETAGILKTEQETLKFIRKHWSVMLPSGGTWEHLNWNRYDGQSCCHAWSSHPAYHLPRLLLGLEQLEPAWKRFRCVPNRKLLPESGEILLPLPPGNFRVCWNTGSVRFAEVPKGCTVLQ